MMEPTVHFLLIAVAATALAVFMGFYVWALWQERFSKDGAKVRSSANRGQSILHTDGGAFYLTGYERRHDDEYYCDLMDGSGTRHSIIVREDELVPKNKLQCFAGPKNAEWIHIPSERGRKIAAQMANDARGVARITELKEGREEALREAKLAKRNIRIETDDRVDSLVKLERTKQPQTPRGGK